MKFLRFFHKPVHAWNVICVEIRRVGQGRFRHHLKLGCRAAGCAICSPSLAPRVNIHHKLLFICRIKSGPNEKLHVLFWARSADVQKTRRRVALRNNNKVNLMSVDVAEPCPHPFFSLSRAIRRSGNSVKSSNAPRAHTNFCFIQRTRPSRRKGERRTSGKKESL